MLNKRIAFRADGNKFKGFGHLYRCLAISSYLHKHFNLTLLTKYQLPEFIEREYERYQVNVISDEQIDKSIEKYIRKDCILIIDNYDFTDKKLKQLNSNGIPIIYIDDFADNKIIADVIINHAEGLSDSDYTKSKYQKLLTGHKYALLRPAFLKKAKSPNVRKISKIRSCLIMTGGTDPDNYNTLFITYLKQLGIEDLHVVGNKIDSVKEVNYYKFLSALDIIALIESVDFAILPSSTVALEAISCRIPFATGTFVDNQKKIYQGIVNEQLAFDLGKFSEISIEKLDQIINDKKFVDISTNMVRRQSKSIDGYSDERIFEIIKTLC